MKQPHALSFESLQELIDAHYRFQLLNAAVKRDLFTLLRTLMDVAGLGQALGMAAQPLGLLLRGHRLPAGLDIDLVYFNRVDAVREDPYWPVQLGDVGPGDFGDTMTSQRRQDRQLQEAAISLCGALLDP